jgi:SAM-dependent methyltransferase
VDADLYARFYAIEDWYWWSVGTRAIFRDWLAAAVAVRPARLLDVGCGTGALAHELAAMGRVAGVDLAPEAIGWSRRRGLSELSVGSADRLPFRSGIFDAVAAVDIVEHTDDACALGEIARVLKPGGAALLHVPAFPILWGEHDEVNHHRRRYRRADLCAVVEASGLIAERVSYANTVLFPAAASVRLAKRAARALRPPRPPAAEIYDLPRWANRALTGVLDLERALLRHVDFPFGVSLLCLARKPDPRAAQLDSPQARV